jgi:hypothetical protein
MLAFEGLAPPPGPPYSEQALATLKTARRVQWRQRFGSFNEFGDPAAAPIYVRLIVFFLNEDSVKESGKDKFFSQAAVNFKDPAFCEKITHEAEVSSGSSDREGFQELLFAKSNCYLRLALRTRRAEFCVHVLPLVKALTNGSGYTKQYCEKQIEATESMGDLGPETCLNNDDVSIFKRPAMLTPKSVDLRVPKPREDL